MRAMPWRAGCSRPSASASRWWRRRSRPVQGVPRGEAGLASGLINTSRMIGGSIGIAGLTTLAASHSGALLSSGHSAAVALSGGYDLAFTVGAGIALAGAGLTALLLRPGRDSVPHQVAARGGRPA